MVKILNNMERKLASSVWQCRALEAICVLCCSKLYDLCFLYKFHLRYKKAPAFKYAGALYLFGLNLVVSLLSLSSLVTKPLFDTFKGLTLGFEDLGVDKPDG